MSKDENRASGDLRQKPLLEWIAALLGLIITLGLIGFIGWEAIKAPDDSPPAIEVVAERVTRVTGGYVVEIVAVNRGPATAAGVEVEGTLKNVAAEPVTSRLTLDYVPGHSRQRGGLFFSQELRLDQLELRAVGYARP